MKRLTTFAVISLAKIVIAAILISFACYGSVDAQSPCTSLIHIGDSTSASIKQRLVDEYTRYGFSDVHVSAGNGRSIPRSKSPDKVSGLEAVRYWRSRTPVGRCWVIALGTNDSGSSSRPASSERIDQMIAELGADRALWINVSTNSKTRPNYNSESADRWNSLLVSKNLLVYDWNSVAKMHKWWFSSDGIHYNGAGSKARASVIAYAAATYLK